MSLEIIPYRFQVRGGTAAALTTVNEVPLRRELVFEMDTGKSKLGDGVTSYNSLPYTSGAAGIEMHASATHLQFRQVGDTDWTDLIPLADFVGVDGAQGPQGPQGPQGGQGSDGPAGDRGADGNSGREVELRVDAGMVQWRHVGAPAWTVLVPLSDLKGQPGVDGAPGADAVGAATRRTIDFTEGQGWLPLGGVALLLQLAITAPARLRIYGTQGARAADASRAATSPPPPGAGLLLEYITTAGLLGGILTPGVVATNGDSPPGNAVYYALEPIGASAAAATLSYITLEP